MIALKVSVIEIKVFNIPKIGLFFLISINSISVFQDFIKKIQIQLNKDQYAGP